MTGSPSSRDYTPLPPFDPRDGVVVKAPELGEPGYWVGAPGVLYERDPGRFLLTYRERRPRGTASERGWRCAVAVSTDGVEFTDIWATEKQALGTSSMERSCLVPTPDGGYALYLSYVDPTDSRWRIDRLTAHDPASFDIAAAEPVLTAASTGTEGVKDPYVLRVGPVTYLFASFAEARDDLAPDAHATDDIYAVGVTTHPTGLATALDGRRFHWHGPVLGTGRGWDRYQTRLNSVVPTAAGFVGFYDGSADHTENYEERCGLAVSPDLRTWWSVSPDEPWVVSPYRTGSVRYLDALIIDDEWFLYYEMTRPDGAHELRLARVPAL